MTENERKVWPSLGRGTLARSRPTFLTRTATDDAERLTRRSSLPPLPGAPSDVSKTKSTQDDGARNPYHPLTEESTPPPHRHDFAKKVLGNAIDVDADGIHRHHKTGSGSRARLAKSNVDGQFQGNSLATHLDDAEVKDTKSSTPKVGAFPRPVGGTEKLDTFSGVFVPTSLNVLSILMFIRFGFILGQSGVVGMLAMLAAAYLINLVTTMSLSAVASNGTVRGGGAYYLISRSLGPEFGGSIGIVSYLGFVFNTGMNAVGLIDCLNYNFGAQQGNWSNTLPEGAAWQYLWSTLVVVICVGICLAGSAIFARASNGLLLILLIATFSIPFSGITLHPFESKKQFVNFTGFSAQTFRENLLPNFTKRAAGSQLKERENYQDLFGILFPATGGILAGASMSGDLKNPSRSIPRGTLGGLALTFVSYAIVILALAASITRESFYRNVNIVQDTNFSGILILAGEIATTFFSVLMGIIGPAKQLQAIARDNIIPGLSIFSQGSAKSDEPTYAIFCTFAIAQLTLLLDINRIASLITMTYLMTFFALNVATFLLKLGSAPNFRPSFHYFNWWTALLGALLSIASMFFVDGLAASGSVCILLVLIAVIHYTTPPKPWGSISEVLIYHQVRKYLLRLRTEHVKFWRPQILLFVNDPRRGYKLIQFCNSLKKGALFILGHVIVTQNFGDSVPEARKQHAAWTKYIDFSQIKAFINVAISPSIEWGARNIVLSAGLGGMRPNIVVFGIYNLQQFRSEQPLVDVPSPPPERKHDPARKRKRSRSQLKGELPTDVCYIEKRTDIQSYVMVLEDMILKLQTNVAIASGFGDLELPNQPEGNTKKYIDLWPIQMSAELTPEEPDPEGKARNLLTTNFDTYTLILQLGCILHTVKSWKTSYQLRVAVFVEYETDVEEEKSRVKTLLDSLRIEAEILVFWLASGDLKSYEFVVNGKDVEPESEEQVNKVLEDEEWWQELQQVRGKLKAGDVDTEDTVRFAEDFHWQNSSFSNKRDSMVRFEEIRKLLQRPKRRSSFGQISNMGVSMSMRTSRLDDDMLSRHASHPSDSDFSDSGLDESVAESETPEESTAVSEQHEDNNEMDLPDMDDMNQPHHEPQTKSLASKKSSRASSNKSKASKSHRNKTSSGGPTSATERTPLLGSSLKSDDAGDSQRGRTLVSRRHSKTDSHLAPEDIPKQQSSVSPGTSLRVSTGQRSRAASPSFTSSPLPVTRIASDENAGPSIMFAESPHPKHKHGMREEPVVADEANGNNTKFIYARTAADRSATGDSSSSPPKSASAPTATGFPVGGSVPLSFNDLPSRAQHLILNDLMAQNSDDTAVIFTTLPAPVEGTYRSESDSLGYLSDLEVLVGGLPPTLLVHSNSMTVTMNL